MASQCWAGLLLLASLVLFLCWTIISARSLDDTLDVPQYRVRTDLPASTTARVQAATEVVKSTLTVIKEVMENIPVDKITDVMKSFSQIASLAPGIGTLVVSVLNMVLAFIPQEDPVLKEVKKGFAEVNRKLDSLAIQVSNLATDVEWFNYASVYSRDEVTILNAWGKFNDLRHNSNLLQTEEERIRLAELFASYYESSGAESSLSNLYRYLTVDSTSLNENLNNLLRNKFKCDANKIGRYNLYLSGLLWKGMVLNQFYWKLMGFDTAIKEIEHIQMFKKVSEAQLAAIDYCLQNYAHYMKNDVVETAKGLSADVSAVAAKVKQLLDKKYNWYNWVVVAYNKAERDNHIVFNATEIDVGEIIVLVIHTPNADLIDIEYVKTTAEKCFSNQYCTTINQDQCQQSHFPEAWGGASESVLIVFKEYAKVSHVTYNENFAEVPAPLERVRCSWSTSGGSISVHFSRRMPVCKNNECQNNGRCERLLESNEWFCRCPAGFVGKWCEQRIDTGTPQKNDIIFPPIKTVQDRLKGLETNLEKLMNRCRM